MYGPSLVSVLVLVSSIGIVIAATTSNLSTVKSSKLVSPRSSKNNNSRKVVTFRKCIEYVDEQCTCVDSHLCDNEKVVSVPTTDGQDQCNGGEVCCKGDIPSLPLQIDPATSTTLPSPSPSLPVENKCDRACICVPFWHCNIDHQSLPIPLADDEIVVIRGFSCEPSDVCCPPCNISQDYTFVTDSTTAATPTPVPFVDVPSPTQPPSDVKVPLPISTESNSVNPVRLPIVTESSSVGSVQLPTSTESSNLGPVRLPTSTDFSTASPVRLPSNVSTESSSISPVRTPISTETSSVSPSPIPAITQECGIRSKTSSETDIDTIISIGERIQNKDENGETEFGEFPWMVALFKTNDDNSTNGPAICGGSLLSPFIVLTAAHCVNKIDKHLLRVRVGEYNIGSNENETLPHQDRTVGSIHIHPKYNSKKLYNDVALLRVNEPFVYDFHVNGICVPLFGTPYALPRSYNPKRCWAAGWGRSNFADKNIQHKLKKVELPIVDHNNCQEKLRKTRLSERFVLDSSFLCAGGQPGYDSCIGDGGGPLFCSSRKNENRFIQVGVVSWGIGCGTTVPGVYASLEANSEWLTNEFNTISVSRTFS